MVQVFEDIVLILVAHVGPSVVGTDSSTCSEYKSLFGYNSGLHLVSVASAL